MTPRFRKLPFSLFALALTIPAAMLVATGTVRAAGRDGFSMEILVDGAPLREYSARNTRYVEALKKREYSVRLHNGTAQRVAIALSVDGLSSIDARTTTAIEARKWVLGPYETITLDGWQTSSTQARRFFFTNEEKSYGAWLGKTKNLGVVAAAVFREKRSLRREITRGEANEGADSKLGAESGSAADQAAPMEGRAAGDASGPHAAPVPESAGGTRSARPDDLAATGIGRETSHPVVQVSFDQEDAPAAVLEIRYEYRDSLVRLGVLPPDTMCEGSLQRRERARGFDDTEYAPDPYRRGCYR